MHPNDIDRLADLLESFVYHTPFEMGSEEDRTLMAALEIVNNHL